MRLILTLLIVLTGQFLFQCSAYHKSLRIDTVRIEDVAVNSLSNTGSAITRIHAEWQGSTVNLYYDSPNGQDRHSYYAEDEYEYGYKNPNGTSTSAIIVSTTNNSEVSWDEINEKENPDTKDLVFVVWSDQTDDKYKDMVFIPGGSFKMGSKFNKNEKPKHTVALNSFYIDKYEVTVAQFRKFCKSTRRKMPKQPYWNNEKHPVVNVNWDHARAYAKWVGKRLPTEAEWEYVARSGNRRLYYAWGNIKPTRRNGGNIADESIRAEKRNWKIWKGYFDGFVYTSPVGSFNPNQFGVYDLTGNVCEWCSDWYQEDYYKNSPEFNPKGPKKGTHKVLRGGSWNLGPRKVLTTKRFYFRRAVDLNYIGFRCARD